MSSKCSSPVAEARSESFLWTSRAENPLVSVSTMNPRIPSGVFAQTIARSATVPFVIHILAPLMTQPSPSGTARVSMPDGSEPWSGSVRPKQPISSPRDIFGRYFSFCSSLPKA